MIVRCFIQTRMKEEDKAKAGTIKGNPGKKTSTTDKHEAEHQEEGRAPMLNRAVKTTLPSVGTVASLATPRQSVTKRRVRQLAQFDNSQTMHPTLTTSLVAKFL